MSQLLLCIVVSIDQTTLRRQGEAGAPAKLDVRRQPRPLAQPPHQQRIDPGAEQPPPRRRTHRCGGIVAAGVTSADEAGRLRIARLLDGLEVEVGALPCDSSLANAGRWSLAIL